MDARTTDLELADVVLLDDATGVPADLIGGKAANLAVMLAAGLPVPPTAVVTTAAFRRAAALPPLAALLADVRNDPTRTDLSDDEIDAAFVAHGMTEDLADRIRAACETVAGEGPVAVRSSATTEDLGQASFAGQYRSVIDLSRHDDIVDAVVRVWASLWHRAPRLYRHLHGYDDDSVAMAVIVQAMVPAVRAGVVFTVNPEGPDDHLRIEDVDGLGEALVSGSITPHATVVGRDALATLPRELRTAAELAVRAERVFGEPQDVEWADDGGRVVLVQSRPITTPSTAETDDGFDSRVRSNRRYTTAGIAEMLPGVFPVLTWSTAAFMVEEAFRHAMDLLHALPATLVGPHGFVVRQRGRAALDLGHLTDVAEALPGGSADQVEQEYFGVSAGAGTNDRVPLGARVRHDLRVLASTWQARREEAVTTVAIEAVLDAPLEPGRLSDHDALALRSRLVDLGARATAAEFNIAAAAAASFRRLGDTLAHHLGEPAGAAWARRTTRSTAPTTTMATVAALRSRLDGASTVLDCDTWNEAATELRRIGQTTLADRILDGRRRAGCQRVVSGPTWDEAPDRYWHLVCDSAGAAADHDIRTDVDELERVLVARPGWNRTRVLTGQVVDIRRQHVRRLIRNTVDLLERREAAKASLLSLGGVIRRIDLELGARLVARGGLLRAEDVVHLHPVELTAALRSGDHPPLDEVLQRRRCVERWESDDELPLTFTGRPSPTPPTPPPGDRLDGWGASPGRHTGPVRYLAEPDETAVEPGDVVVAVRTDASWSPVFVRAAAVVVEQGGPLSHAAIVARELGLPAVVNVPGVVARLRHEPRQVTVDGDIGAVFVQSPDEPVGDEVVR